MNSELNRAVKALLAAGFRQQAIDISPMLAALLNAQHTIMYFEGARFHEKRFQQYGDRLGYAAELVRNGLKIPQSEYDGALRVVSEGRERMSGIYRTTPVILGPAATGPAPLGLQFTGDARMEAPWTALGTPAISIPMPVQTGLPLGMQLTSAMGDDARLLRTAARVYGALHGKYTSANFGVRREPVTNLV
jgi:Asp-tRNA(Asn)/Glu-tRNA(Gln) amidotransferase A subunit family amidase